MQFLDAAIGSQAQQSRSAAMRLRC